MKVQVDAEQLLGLFMGDTQVLLNVLRQKSNQDTSRLRIADFAETLPNILRNEREVETIHVQYAESQKALRVMPTKMAPFPTAQEQRLLALDSIPVGAWAKFSFGSGLRSQFYAKKRYSEDWELDNRAILQRELILNNIKYIGVVR